MKLGFQLALYLLCLNLVCGLVYRLGVAGTSYTNPIQDVGDPSDYTDRFDPEDMMEETQPSIWNIAPWLSALVSGLMMFWNAVVFIFAGFPALLWQFGGLIPDATARTSYEWICAVIGAVESFVIFGWIIQIWTGRVLQD